MAKKTKIYKICYHCDGIGKKPIFINGEEQPGDENCPICKGKGKILWGIIKEEEEE